MKFLKARRWFGVKFGLVMSVGAMGAGFAQEGKASTITDSSKPSKSITPDHPASVAQQMVLQTRGISQG